MEKISPKISIIVPVYNVEKNLKKCIDSLINQDFKDIEIILVNDGSTDNSLSICEQYKLKDDRIRLFNKENGGVSSARNIGIQQSRGEFIGFVDSDDWIEPQMFSSMYTKAKLENADVILCNYYMNSNDKVFDIPSDMIKKGISTADIKKYLISNMISNMSLNSNGNTILGSAWRLLISKRLLINNTIQFEEQINFMEDLLFVINVLLVCERVRIDNGYYYHYVQRTNSAVNQYRPDYLEESQLVFNKLLETFKKNGIFNEFESRMKNRYINMKLLSISNEVKNATLKNIGQIFSKINKIVRDEEINKILKNVNTKGYTIRKKIVLGALYKENVFILFLYFHLIHRL